jgi:hypothetical protein
MSRVSAEDKTYISTYFLSGNALASRGAQTKHQILLACTSGHVRTGQHERLYRLVSTSTRNLDPCGEVTTISFWRELWFVGSTLYPCLFNSLRPVSLLARAKGRTDSDPGVQKQPAKSVAVLYFENLTGAKEDEYLRDGITEDVIAELSKIRGLNIFSRPTVLACRDKPVTPAQVGQQLGAAPGCESYTSLKHCQPTHTPRLVPSCD